jgi:hypothetical protein
MEHVICSKGLLLVKNRFTVYTPNPLGLPYYIIGIYGVIWGYMGLSPSGTLRQGAETAGIAKDCVSTDMTLDCHKTKHLLSGNLL